jgi:hypothetical protein
MLSRLHGHCQICDWQTSTALHQRKFEEFSNHSEASEVSEFKSFKYLAISSGLSASDARWNQLQQPNQLQQIHRNLHLHKPRCNRQNAKEHAVVVPQRSFQLCVLHDDFCCGLLALRFMGDQRFILMFSQLYLHSRVQWRASKLFKHSLQFVVVLMAVYTALSRISDYKHHCELARCLLTKHSI